MVDTLLATTSVDGLTPLGTPAQRSFELISGAIRDQLGDRHADLIAEPVGNQYGDRVDWYAAMEGKRRKLTDLDGDERAQADALLEELISDILERARALLEDDDTEKQRLGEALANSVRFPGPESVFVVGEGVALSPVLVNWAWVADDQTACPGELSDLKPQARKTKPEHTTPEMSREAEPVPPPPPPPVRRRTEFNHRWLLWLGWLLLVLIIAAILYLLVEACALRLPVLQNHCPPSGLTASGTERQAHVLRNRIAAVEREIGIAGRSCRTDSLLLRGARRGPEQDDFDARRDAEGGQVGDLNFSLIWEGPDDLDLHVTCPNGQTIWFQQMTACKGEMDIDSNAAELTQSPIESVFFVAPDIGAYRVSVNLYRSRSGGEPRRFQIRISEGGLVRALTGTVDGVQREWNTMYQVGGR